MASDRADFRPDLEGLRGLAILFVVLYHAEVAGLAGGFVGVDVFFVLSGFFITGLLVREFSRDGTIDIPAFYGRRALRLLPPLLLVLLATLALVMGLFAPIDRPDIVSSARAVALSAGNIEFARGSVDYFSRRENPLLHTWSLGVEEQFYLIWAPLVLLFALLAERRRAAAAAAEESDGVVAKWLLLGFALVGALSLGAALWLTQTAQPWAFFGTPARLWEFALGGALALTIDRRGTSPPLGTVLQLAGLVAIGFGVLTYDRLTPYPGTAALLPALGAVALIVGGRVAPEGVVSRALAVPALRWLGRVSYAWYLWHWPLVGVGAVLAPELGVPGRLAWSAAALGLAWLTYAVVERSGRDGRLSRIPTEKLPLAALVASVVAAVVAQGALMVARHQAARPEQLRLAAARQDRMQHGCWANGSEPVGECVFGDTRSATTVVLFGDSHAEHWLGALDRVGKARGWRIELMVMGGCPVSDLSEVPRRARHSDACAEHRERTVQRIIAMRPAAAILSSWDHYIPVDGDPGPWQVSPADWRRGLRQTYERLTAAKIPVVAVRGTPRTWFDAPACLSRRAAGLPFAGDCTYDRARSLSQVAYAAQTDAARGLPVRFVDMNDAICATPRCPVQRNGGVVFTDDNHLTASFSRSMAPVFAARLDAALGGLGVRLP
jgi:peptidoglycan/LPS O-acetylase OafA/YrhL